MNTNASSYFTNFTYLDFHLEEILNKSSVEEVNQRTINSFKRRAGKFVSDYHHIFQKYCAPSEYGMVACDYFYYHYKVLYSIIEAYNHENKEIKISKNKFIKYISDYNKKGDKLKNINKFINDELLKIKDHVVDFEKINQISSLFEKIIEEPHLLQFPISVFVKQGTITDPNFSISVINLIDFINRYIEKSTIDVKDAIDIIENTLNKYVNNLPSDEVEYLNQLRESISKLKRHFFPLLLQLEVKNIPDLKTLNRKLSHVQELCKDMHDLMPDMKLLKTPAKYEYCFDDWSGLVDEIREAPKEMDRLNVNQYVLDLGQKKLSVQRGDNRLLNFYKDITFCHLVLKNTCLSPVFSIKAGYRNLVSFFSVATDKQIKAINRLIQAKLNHSLIESTNELAAQQEETIEKPQSIEDLVAFINSNDKKSKPQSNRSKSRQPSRRGSATKTQALNTPSIEKKAPEKKTKLLVNASSHSSTLENLSDSLATPHADRELAHLSALLESLCQDTTHPLMKGCVRHAHMYLNDLSVSLDRLRDERLSDPARRFYFMAYIQATYYCCEALLHYQNGANNPRDFKIDGSGHNLNKLFDKAKIKEKNKIISDLFLANYWIRSPFVKWQIWKRFNHIQVLDDIRKIYRSSDFKQTEILMTVKKITDFVSSTKQFIQSLPSIRHLSRGRSVQSSSHSVLTYQIEKFSLSELQEVCQKCEERIEKLPSVIGLKIHQVIAHLKLIEGILDELNQEVITSDQFSLIVRHMLFWKNTILEEFLQIAHHLKTGTDIQTHHLTTIYELIWPNSTPEDLQFLKRFEKLHNISRYPFTVPETENQFYDYILKGESLRQHPELGIGFKLQKGRTPLNYRSPSSDEVNPQVILKELHMNLLEVLQFFNLKIFPELMAYQAH